MCYFLYMASPLTLSEIRSMLPAGLTADLAPARRTSLHRLHPPARTVAKLVIGGCSCDLFRPRQANPIEDERELRSRYTQAKLSRSQVIKALERHRGRSLAPSAPVGGWSAALAAFVVEHARNAGPTLYLLEFGHDEMESAYHAATTVGCSVHEVRQHRDGWLAEGKPTVVG